VVASDHPPIGKKKNSYASTKIKTKGYNMDYTLIATIGTGLVLLSFRKLINAWFTTKLTKMVLQDIEEFGKPKQKDMSDILLEHTEKILKSKLK
jgi:hypothetical protein